MSGVQYEGTLDPPHADPSTSISTSSFLPGTPVWKLIPLSSLKLKKECEVYNMVTS
jgi:hypothetical protein